MSFKTNIIIALILILSTLFIPTAFAFNQKVNVEDRKTEAAITLKQMKKFAAIRDVNIDLSIPKELQSLPLSSNSTEPAPVADKAKSPDADLPRPLNNQNLNQKPQAVEQSKIVARQPNTTTNSQPVIYNTEYIKKRICEVFGPQCSNALIIAQRESGFRIKVISPTNDYGLFQINCPSHAAKVGGDCTKLFDLETNLSVAKQIFNASGWCPWTTAKYLSQPCNIK
jgi:hypothetical protein